MIFSRRIASPTFLAAETRWMSRKLCACSEPPGMEFALLVPTARGIPMREMALAGGHKQFALERLRDDTNSYFGSRPGDDDAWFRRMQQRGVDDYREDRFDAGRIDYHHDGKEGGDDWREPTVGELVQVSEAITASCLTSSGGSVAAAHFLFVGLLRQPLFSCAPRETLTFVVRRGWTGRRGNRSCGRRGRRNVGRGRRSARR